MLTEIQIHTHIYTYIYIYILEWTRAYPCTEQVAHEPVVITCESGTWALSAKLAIMGTLAMGQALSAKLAIMGVLAMGQGHRLAGSQWARHTGWLDSVKPTGWPDAAVSSPRAVGSQLAKQIG